MMSSIKTSVHFFAVVIVPHPSENGKEKFARFFLEGAAMRCSGNVMLAIRAGLWYHRSIRRDGYGISAGTLPSF